MDTYKYIRVPAPIKPISGGPEYSLKNMIEYLVDNDPRFQAPASRVRQGVRILAAFDAEDAAEIVKLKVEDHQYLQVVVEDPKCGYGTWMYRDRDGNPKELEVSSRGYLPLIDAVDQATNGDPREARAT